MVSARAARAALPLCRLSPMAERAVAEPPLSTAQKVLVVAEGGTFRAQLEAGDGGLGLTLKATRDGRALVQALPAPSRARASATTRRI